MKKLALITLGVAAIVTSIYAATQIKNTAAGYQIGTSATQLVGFFGATPIAQPANSNQVAVTLTDGGAGDVTNVVKLVNRLRLDLVNLGLIKGTN